MFALPLKDKVLLWRIACKQVLGPLQQWKEASEADILEYQTFVIAKSSSRCFDSDAAQESDLDQQS